MLRIALLPAQTVIYSRNVKRNGEIVEKNKILVIDKNKLYYIIEKDELYGKGILY